VDNNKPSLLVFIINAINVKKRYKILFGILALVIVIRIILPYVVLHYANKTLANMNGYFGRVDDIDLSLFRGAYIIYDIYLNKVDARSKEESVFFKSKSIDLSVEWKSIFDGAIVGELIFESPVLIFTKDKVELKDVSNDTSDFRKLLRDFMPLKVNRFEVIKGDIHYVDNTVKPKLDVALTQAHMLARNLSNVTDDKVTLPSTLAAKATVYEGSLTLDMKLNSLNKHPTFDLNAELKNTNLVLINDFFKAYGNFDVNKGNFGLYTEMAAKDGKIAGYVKPIIKDLDVVGPADRHDSFINRIYEQVLDFAGVIFKNQRQDQLATKISFEGEFNDPKTNTLEIILEVFRNAFVQALLPSVDHEINLKSLSTINNDKSGNFIQRLFSSDKSKNEKKK